MLADVTRGDFAGFFHHRAALITCFQWAESVGEITEAVDGEDRGNDLLSRARR
jgi:hypothetical protein